MRKLLSSDERSMRPLLQLQLNTAASFSSSAAAVEEESSIKEGPRNDWSRQEIKSIYDSPILDLLFHAAQVHRHAHNFREVQQCTLLSIKTGGCSEDCSYCPQSSRYNTGLKAQKLMNEDAVLEAAKKAKEAGSTRFCIGAAWRDTTGRKTNFNKILEYNHFHVTRGMGMEVCCTLGVIEKQRAIEHKKAGLTAYSHNLDTSREYYPNIITTRSYDEHERLQTLEHVRDAGINVCSGDPVTLVADVNNSARQVVEHSYSCALERSFLYHGRIYASAWHICFRSNVFSKQMKVIILFGDIDEIRKSQHAFINPAITIILRMGAGGHGVPPLGNLDGRVRCKFASFWNRNHALRGLQRAVKNYHAMLEAEKKEKEQSALRAHSSSIKGSKRRYKFSEENVPQIDKFQPFIKEEVLSEFYNDVFPSTAEQFFKFLLDDGSTFTNEYRGVRKDSSVVLGQWHSTDEYDGQAHDVPFGSYFEAKYYHVLIFCADFKKWCVMQSEIKSRMHYAMINIAKDSQFNSNHLCYVNMILITSPIARTSRY
ncbi:biotin synthase [Phtheirospermum japonicum]|uniref:Biotin synthase n=1 Tax=Phtheirospermum japonicum TaxID=374723 RepID=A0A830D6Q4_9LAMI|nr:biotin synthase [Phtheirospermum japonicum]